MREQGIETLLKVLSIKKNADIIEKNIYEISKDDDDLYTSIIYQVVHDIFENKHKLSVILENVKKNNYSWNHECFKEMILEEEEQDEFITNPFEVVEGIIQCNCGSKRVYSYSKQTRSNDEAATTFSQCLSCKQKWKTN